MAHQMHSFYIFIVPSGGRIALPFKHTSTLLRATASPPFSPPFLVLGSWIQGGHLATAHLHDNS